ncbi:MAG: helix-hairpin-helix domain-containing protein [Candidatus Bathyarchaeia archaeon]
MTGRPEPEVPAVTPLDVSEVKGIGGARAEKLKSAGYGTVESLAEAEPGRLSELTGISEKLTAKFIESAKELLEQR